MWEGGCRVGGAEQREEGRCGCCLGEAGFWLRAQPCAEERGCALKVGRAQMISGVHKGMVLIGFRQRL